MTEEAGELRIPFTSGLLIGIGETVRRAGRYASCDPPTSTVVYGHIGEVIVQNFRAHPSVTNGDWRTEPRAQTNWPRRWRWHDSSSTMT